MDIYLLVYSEISFQAQSSLLGTVLMFCNSEALPSMLEVHSSSFIWKERKVLNCSLPQNILKMEFKTIR